MIYPWQQNQWQQFLKAFSQQRLSHAYLLSGVKGLGKTSFAQMCVAYLLCEQPISNQPSGHCQSCCWLQAQTHPDYYGVVPHEDKHAIKIDQIRTLTNQLAHKSSRGGYQAVVIAPANAMPVAAANALLKTLEEPPGDVIIFLVVDVLDQVLPTIRSRCQHMHFSSVNNTQALTWLKTELACSDDTAAALLSVTGGAPIAAKQFLAADYLSLRDEVLQHFLQMAKQQVNPVAPIAEWVKKESDLIFYALLSIAIDLSRVQMQVSSELMNRDRLPQLQQLQRYLSASELQRWLQKLLEAKRLLASGINLNQQLLFEDILLSLKGALCL